MRKMTFIAFFVVILNAQSQGYGGLIKKADSCYAIKNYKLSTAFFQKAFAAKPELKENFYNAACAASLANEKKKALKWFETAVINGFDNLDHISTDTDIDFIRKEKKFIKIMADLQKKADAIEVNYDKPLQKELLEIYREDQEIRKQYSSVKKKIQLSGKRNGQPLGNYGLKRQLELTENR